MPRDRSSSTRLARWLRASYLAACLAMLAWYWLHRSDPEAAIALGWMIVSVTIPAGLLGGLLAGSVLPAVNAVTVWLVCAVLGYLQWFVLVPWLWRIRDRELERRNGAA